MLKVDIILIGSGSVGKTAFGTRFMKENEGDAYNIDYDSIKPTIGCDLFKTKLTLPSNQIIDVNIWDTAGQERYKSLTKNYFHKADGVVLAYDITCPDSFYEVKDNGWMESVMQYCPEDIPKTLIGNKCDLEVDREIESSLGVSLAELYNIPFYETSGMSGYNVYHVIQDLVERIVDSLN